MDDKEIAKYNKTVEWQILIKNSITLICFTVLAIVFNKWWLVLFAIIFWATSTTEKDKEL